MNIDFFFLNLIKTIYEYIQQVTTRLAMPNVLKHVQSVPAKFQHCANLTLLLVFRNSLKISLLFNQELGALKNFKLI